MARHITIKFYTAVLLNDTPAEALEDFFSKLTEVLSALGDVELGWVDSLVSDEEVEDATKEQPTIDLGDSGPLITAQEYWEDHLLNLVGNELVSIEETKDVVEEYKTIGG